MIHRPKSALGIILATMALLMFNPSAACAQSAKSLTVPPKSFEEHGYTAGAAGASNRTWRVRPSTVENVKNFKSDQAGGGPARMNAAVVAIPGEFFPELLSSALAGGQSMADSMLEEPDIHAFVSPAVAGGTPFPATAVALLCIVVLVLLYALRHYYFTLNRLFGRQRHPYLDIDEGDWPSVTVFIAAHNEEAVIAGSFGSLLQVDYPADRLLIMPVNDRSSDRTREIIDGFVAANPGRIVPFHRTEGKPGKAAALKDATRQVTSEIIVVFDADYLPSRSLIKQLVTPFFDPEIGATMGRVVPLNVGTNLLTRLLDLERSGGYQVDQQARMNLGMVPQYGGTVGGIRVQALAECGGWHDDVLAEDTDLTYRLLLKDWKTVYQNRAECYEEVPENWDVRVRQIMRWAKGHNQAMWRHTWRVLFAPGLSLPERLDGAALLGVYLMAPLLLVGWALAMVLFYTSGTPWLSGILALFSVMCYSAMGNFAAFFEIAAAAHLDGSRQRLCRHLFTYRRLPGGSK